MPYNVKDSVRQVLSCAAAETVRLRPAYVGPDHIPLGLPRHGDGAGAALLVLWCILCAPSAGAAQRLPERLQPIRPPTVDSVRRYSPSYWVEGAAIGAAVLGATTVFVAAGLCEFGDGGTPCRPGVYVASAAVGGAVWSVGVLCHGLGHGCGRGEPVFGISVSLVGALAGWLVGR